MTNQPLLLLSTQRIQQEMERARAMGAAARYELVRHRWLLAAWLVQFVAGLTLMVRATTSRGRTWARPSFWGAFSSATSARSGPGFWPIGMAPTDRDVAA